MPRPAYSIHRASTPPGRCTRPRCSTTTDQTDNPYRPGTPKKLLYATKDHHGHAIDKATFKARTIELRHFKLYAEERKPNGKTTMRCPARALVRALSWESIRTPLLPQYRVNITSGPCPHFGTAILGFLTILFTFGIYLFWGDPRLQRWITVNTEFAQPVAPDQPLVPGQPQSVTIAITRSEPNRQ